MSKGVGTQHHTYPRLREVETYILHPSDTKGQKTLDSLKVKPLGEGGSYNGANRTTVLIRSVGSDRLWLGVRKTSYELRTLNSPDDIMQAYTSSPDCTSRSLYVKNITRDRRQNTYRLQQTAERLR